MTRMMAVTCWLLGTLQGAALAKESNEAAAVQRARDGIAWPCAAIGNAVRRNCRTSSAAPSRQANLSAKIQLVSAFAG